MHPIFGIILIAAAGFAYWKFGKPLAEAQQAEAALVPDEERLLRLRGASRALLTFAVVLAAVVGMIAIEAVVHGAAGRVSARWYAGGGAVAVLAGLWCPWALIRVLSALTLTAAVVAGAILGLVIAAGGPDSRGGMAPAAIPILLGGIVLVAAPLIVMIWAEVLLWRRAGEDAGEAKLSCL